MSLKLYTDIYMSLFPLDRANMHTNNKLGLKPAAGMA